MKTLNVHPIFQRVIEKLKGSNQIKQCPPCMGNCLQGRQCPAHGSHIGDVASTGIAKQMVNA